MTIGELDWQKMKAGKRQLTYGACYVLFNEEDYIKSSLDSIYEWADKIYILIGDPFDGSTVEKDDTENIVRNYKDPEKKMTIMYTSETDESKCKNYLKSLCVRDALDYCWIIDGDEVYDERAMPGLFKVLEHYNGKIETALFGGLEYWKSLHHAIKIERHYTFFIADNDKSIYIRSPVYDSLSLKLPNDIIIYHHYGLAKTPSRIRIKYTTTRVREYDDDYFELDRWMNEKFLAWKDNKDVEDLYPFKTGIWEKTIKIEDTIMPEIMKKHKWYGIDCIEDKGETK